MAHVAKYSKGAMGHMMAHYDRSKDCGDNVDKERTHLNYNEAAHQQLTQLEFIHKRLSEVQVHNRKDVNVMCDWVVTAPKDFLAEHPDREREFFDSAYRFLEAKYGKENVISAHVHKDEVTPHMHFAFVPVVYDQKKERFKLSAKECVTRGDLKSFHSELPLGASEARFGRAGHSNQYRERRHQGRQFDYPAAPGTTTTCRQPRRTVLRSSKRAFCGT